MSIFSDGRGGRTNARRRVALAAPLLSVMLIAGCTAQSTNNANNTNNANAGNANNTNANRGTTPGSNANASASPASNANAAADAGAGGSKVTKPEDAARQFFKAWQAGDRAAARNIASEAAVTELFKTEGKGNNMQFMGCDDSEGKLLCSYYYEGGGLSMRMSGSAADGYKVAAVEFIAD